MSNTYGKIFCVTTWGESHGPALGCVIDGCPAGISLSEKDIQKDLDRRKPGQSNITTQRQESDTVQILSGVFEGKTTGTSISLIVYNQDQRSADYSKIKNIFRPGHADYTFQQKYGIRDYRGGGRSSGRETLARVAAGAVAKKVLEPNKIQFIAHTKQVGNIIAKNFDPKQIDKNIIRCADKVAAEKMITAIEKVKKTGDSLGGIIELIIKYVPVGLGEPVFDKFNAELAKSLMSIGAVKGIEFGTGFSVATKKGSENNDLMVSTNGKLNFLTNNSGGTLGGITTGQDIVVRLAIKPTSSICLRQKTVDVDYKNTNIEVTGRHDPCLCPRIVPVVEAMAALTVADFWLIDKVYNGKSEREKD